MRYINTKNGIKKILAGQFFMVIAAVLLSGTALLISIIMNTSIETEDINLPILGTLGILSFGFVSVIATLTSAVLCFLGYTRAAKDEPEFKKAVGCTIALGALTVFGSVFKIPNGTLSTIFSSAGTIVEMFIIIFSLSGIVNISAGCDRTDMVDRGDRLLKIMIATYIISAMDALVIRIFELSSQARIISVLFGTVDLIISLIQYVLYILYLKQSVKMIEAVNGESNE